MLRIARGTQALLDLEDDAPDVLYESVPGSTVPLWPHLRDQFAIALDRLEYPVVPISAPQESRSKVWARLARSFVPSRWDASRVRHRAPVCFLVAGTTTRPRSGREHNWLIGEYAQLLEDDAVVLQWRPLPSALGEPDFAATWSLDPLVTRAAGWARLSLRDPSSKIRAIVEEIGRRLSVGIPPDALADIAGRATYAERQRPLVERRVARILDRVAPSVVLVKSASYGHYASLVAMMKDRGIHVAEPQHGWIGPTHAAYNFGHAMHAPALRKVLPDEVLLFGEYWGRGLRHPGRMTVIGKPHLDEAVSRAPRLGDRPKEVLVVSSTADPEEMSDFALSLRHRLEQDWTVVFRPHPSERATFDRRYPRLVGVKGVRVDERDDVADALAEARVVVGVASTVLFEALAFGCRVYVRDSPFRDYYVGSLFGEPIVGEAGMNRLVAGIHADGETSDEIVSLAQSMWQPHGLENFERWVSEYRQ